MEQKPVYKTRYNKDIFDGQTYVALFKDNSIAEMVAKKGEKKNPDIVERFLNAVGAKQYLKKVLNINTVTVREKPSQEEVVVAPAPKKTAEELEEERIAAMSPFQQLDVVKDVKDFKAWLKRNNLTVTTTTNNYTLSVGNLINFGFRMSGVPHCCGGREMGSHTGSIGRDAQNLTEARMEILATYIVDDFDNLIEKAAANYGIVSYVRRPGNISDCSARIGFLHDKSELFHKTATFKNPNTQTLIAIYTITDEWMNNE